MVELTVRTDAESWERIISGVRAAVADAPYGSAAWCTAPYLAAMQDRGPRRGVPVLVGPQEHLRHHALALSGVHALRVETAGSVMGVGASDNQWRVMEPILSAVGDRRSIGRQRLAPSRLSVDRIERRRVDRLAAALGGDALANRRSAHRALRKAIRARAVAEQIFRSSGIDRLLVSTQHDVGVRAFLASARDHGVPAVYVPHAPLATSAIYNDLPVDVAALRGEFEQWHYRGIGAAEDGLVVIGDPSTGDGNRGAATTVHDGAIVLALSWPLDDLIAEQVALVASATEEPVLVAPHPTSDRDALQRMLPSHWQLPPVGRRTWDVLLDGPSCVIQHSSGVALEALSLGLFTVQLDVPGRPPAYPLIAEPTVPFVRSTAQLRSVLADRVPQNCDGPRARRLEAAAGWCRVRGPEAVRNAVRAVEDARLRPSPLLDAWGRGS